MNANSAESARQRGGGKNLTSMDRFKLLPQQEQTEIRAHIRVHGLFKTLPWLADNFGICVGAAALDSHLRGEGANALRETLRDQTMARLLLNSALDSDHRAYLDILAKDQHERDSRLKAGREDARLALEERRVKVLEYKDGPRKSEESKLSLEEKRRRIQQLLAI